MKAITLTQANIATATFAISLFFSGCAEEGEAADLDCGQFGHEHDGECHCDTGYQFDGTTCAPSTDGGPLPLDCGIYGHEHSGHCHCDPGYLFDGQTCVLPDSIHEACAPDQARHHACRCPVTGVCPCDHGTIESFGGDAFCVPELD